MTTPAATPRTEVPWHTVLLRGLVCRCPSCGRGRTLRGYLRVAETCAVCHVRFGHLRPDDAAAWLTISIVGTLVFPGLLIAEMGWHPPVPLTIGVALAGSAALVLALLPPSKGLILAVLWRLDDGHGGGAADQ